MLVRAFFYFHTLYIREAKALARLHICAGMSEPLLMKQDTVYNSKAFFKLL